MLIYKKLYISEEALNNHLKKINKEYDKYLNDIVSDTKQFKNIIDVISFVAKALAMRDHKCTELWMNKVRLNENENEPPSISC